MELYDDDDEGGGDDGDDAIEVEDDVQFEESIPSANGDESSIVLMFNWAFYINYSSWLGPCFSSHTQILIGKSISFSNFKLSVKYMYHLGLIWFCST